MGFTIPIVVAKIRDPERRIQTGLEQGRFGDITFRPLTEGVVVDLPLFTNMSTLPPGRLPESVEYRLPDFLPPETRLAFEAVETAWPNHAQVVCAIGGGPMKPFHHESVPQDGEPHAKYSIPEIVISVVANSSEFITILEHKLVGGLGQPTVVQTLKGLFLSGPQSTLPNTLRRYADAASAAVRKAQSASPHHVNYYRLH